MEHKGPLVPSTREGRAFVFSGYMATPNKKSTKTLKCNIPVSLMERVNNYRHSKHFDSVTEAVISLLESSLAAADLKGE